MRNGTESPARNVKKVTIWDVAVGRELRACREQKGYSQPKVQELVEGLDGSMLSYIERGTQRVSVGMLIAISRALGTDPATVLVRAGVASGSGRDKGWFDRQVGTMGAANAEALRHIADAFTMAWRAQQQAEAEEAQALAETQAQEPG